MKKLILLIPFLFSGCALYDAYFMAKFDVNEYQYITRLRTQAELAIDKCGTPEVIPSVNYVHTVALEFKNYAEKIPHNENAYSLATTLTSITDEFYKRYQSDKLPSKVYCQAKFKAIEGSSKNIQEVLGAKPR